MQIAIADMNRIPKLALISLSNPHLFHFKNALFHSTHARKVDPRRRAHWDPKPYRRTKNLTQETLLRKAEHDNFEYGPFPRNDSSRLRNRNGWREEFSGPEDDSKRAQSRARKKGFPFYDDEEEDGPKYWSDGSPRRNSSAHQNYKQASWSNDEESSKKSHKSSESQILGADFSKDRIALGLSGSGPLTLQHVKTAYRACAMQWHPDRHDGSSKAIAEEKFKACSSAYESLCDKLASI